MSKKERIYYFGIIVAQFLLILLLYLNLVKCKKTIPMATDLEEYQSSRLFSFSGKDKDGNVKPVQFTAYSYHRYIIVTYSKDCPHCQPLIDDLGATLKRTEMDENIRILLVTTDTLDSVNSIWHPNFLALRVNFDDFVQFGMDTPSIMAANGKGDILFHRKGYVKGALNGLIENLKEMQ